MTEFYQPVNRANILAQALFETESPMESSKGEVKTAYVEWDIEAGDLTCELERRSNPSGTSFTLEVFRSDEYYEDFPDDEECLEIGATDTGGDEEYDPQPIEKYELSYLFPGTIQKDMNLGHVFMDARDALGRVTWLLEQANISQDRLESKEAENEDFWRVVGAYALSDVEVERRLIRLKSKGRRYKRAAAKLAQDLTERNYGLTKNQMLGAMDIFYDSSYGQEVVKNGQSSYETRTD